MKKFWFPACASGLACLVFLFACNKDPNFLHYVPPAVKAPSYSLTHRLSDLAQGSALDVLWVVDNSASMSRWQRSVVDNLDGFIDTFSADKSLDWKMGLISSDTTDEPYIGFTPNTVLDHTTANGNSLFKNAISRLGTNGDGVEKFVLPMKMVLTNHPEFSRRDATLAIIIITDTEDQSEQDRQAPTNAADGIAFLKNYKGDQKKVIVYDILGATDFGCPITDDGYYHDNAPWNWTDSRQKTFFDAFPGKVFKLCDSDFGKNLVTIGKDIVKRVVHPIIPLSVRPNTATIKIYHAGVLIPGGSAADGGYWIYDFDQNAIVFERLDFAQKDTEEILVTFEPAT